MRKRDYFYLNILAFCLTIFSSVARGNIPGIITNLPSKNTYSISRKIYLNELQKKLTRYDTVYLAGHEGIGKSQLVRKYIYSNEQKYDLIWWFDLKTDLLIQYQTLLTHLSHSNKFKKNDIDIAKILPQYLIDFVNLLLTSSDYKWLLVFNNWPNNKNINLPKIKNPKHNVIIIIKGEPAPGDNVLTLQSFTNEEAEFLSQTPSQKKKEESIKPSKIQHDHLLTLTQIGEKIARCNNKIVTYFKKIGGNPRDTSLLYSNSTQTDKDDNYKKWTFTLEEIEKKDSAAAAVLSMLALLDIDLGKLFIEDLFGREGKKSLEILDKYAAIQLIKYRDTENLHIQNTLKEIAIKKFNSKNAAYQKEIINPLIKYFSELYARKNFWFLNSINPENDYIKALYAFINIILQNNIIDNRTIDILCVSLRLNDDLFNRYDDNVLYNQLAKRIYNNNLDNITPDNKALLYASLIFANFIFETNESLKKFEKEMTYLVDILEKHKNYNQLFFIYTRLSGFCLGLGNFKDAKEYNDKATKMLNHIDNIFYLAEYWYNNVSLSYEFRDIASGMAAINNYTKISNNLKKNEITKFILKKYEILFKMEEGKIAEAKEELASLLKDYLKYHKHNISKFYIRLIFIKAQIYFQNNQYELAEQYCLQTLKACDTLSKNDPLDYRIYSVRPFVYTLLGELAEKKKNYKNALEMYKKALIFYRESSYNRIINFYEYGRLLANLCLIYYKQNNLIKSKLYYQKLIINFGIDHRAVKNLIKKLPNNYVYEFYNKAQIMVGR